MTKVSTLGLSPSYASYREDKTCNGKLPTKGIFVAAYFTKKRIDVLMVFIPIMIRNTNILLDISGVELIESLQQMLATQMCHEK